MRKKEIALTVCVILVIAVIAVLAERADSYKLQAEHMQTVYKELQGEHAAAVDRVTELEREINDRNLNYTE